MALRAAQGRLDLAASLQAAAASGLSAAAPAQQSSSLGVLWLLETGQGVRGRAVFQLGSRVRPCRSPSHPALQEEEWCSLSRSWEHPMFLTSSPSVTRAAGRIFWPCCKACGRAACERARCLQTGCSGLLPQCRGLAMHRCGRSGVCEPPSCLQDQAGCQLGARCWTWVLCSARALGICVLLLLLPVPRGYPASLLGWLGTRSLGLFSVFSRMTGRHCLRSLPHLRPASIPARLLGAWQALQPL